MGRWLTKKAYRERAMRIIELKDEYGLSFADIGRRLSIQQTIVERCYHQFKEKM